MGSATTYKVPTPAGPWPIIIYEPTGLTASAPLLVYAEGPRGGDTIMQKVADTRRFRICSFLCFTNVGTYRSGDENMLPLVIDFVVARFRVDTTRVYLHGCSKGGNLTQLALRNSAVMPRFAGFAPASIAWNAAAQNKPTLLPPITSGDYSLYYLFGGNDKFGLYTFPTGQAVPGPCGSSGTPVNEPGCIRNDGTWKYAPMAATEQLRKDLGYPAYVVNTSGATGKLVQGVASKGGQRALGYRLVKKAGHCFDSMNKFDGYVGQDDVAAFLLAH